MRRALALLVLLSFGSAAAEPPAQDVPVLPAAPPPEGLVLRDGVVTLEQDGSHVQVQEGCWLSTRACLDSAKRLASAEAERDELRKEESSTPFTTLALAFALGLAAGATGVALLRR